MNDLLFNASFYPNGQEEQSSFSRMGSYWRKFHRMSIGSLNTLLIGNFRKWNSYYWGWGQAEASTKQYQPSQQSLPKSKSGLNTAGSKASFFLNPSSTPATKGRSGVLFSPCCLGVKMRLPPFTFLQAKGSQDSH